MGKSSSAKKVARAARAGGTTSSTDKREIGFPLVIAGVFLVGTAGIFAAKSTQTAAAEGVELGQHWHASYEIIACGEPVPGQLDEDPNAVHHIHAHLNGEGTEPDGLMHIHPQSSQFTRDGGTIGAFFENTGATLSDDKFELSDGTVFEEGVTKCDGEDAVLRIAKWNDAFAIDGEADEIRDRSLARTRFQKDGETFTIFFGPDDAAIPPPSNAASVANASDIQAPTVLDESLLTEDGVTAEDIEIETTDAETGDEDETGDEAETETTDEAGDEAETTDEAGDEAEPVDGADEG